MAGGRQLFVYYRVNASNVDAAIAAAGRVQSALRQRHPGLQAALMRRPDAVNGQVTLMETYALAAWVDALGVDEALQRAIELDAARAMAPWIVGERRVEVFVSCA